MADLVSPSSLCRMLAISLEGLQSLYKGNKFFYQSEVVSLSLFEVRQEII